MLCKNCGHESSDGLTYCPRCGTPFESGGENTDTIEEPVSKAAPAESNPKKPRTKLIAVIIIIAAAIVVIVLLAVFLRFNNNTDSADLMESGQMYTDSQEYEVAIGEYTEALGQGQDMGAYQGLAEAYIGLGDTENAESTYSSAFDCAEEQYEKTGELPDGTEDVYVSAITYYGEKGDTDTAASLADEITGIIDDAEDIAQIESLKDEYVYNWAYYGKVTEYLGIYGSPQAVTEGGNSYITGLSSVILEDLDGDGQDELLLAYYDPDSGSEGYQVELWDVVDGELSLIYDCTLDLGGAALTVCSSDTEYSFTGTYTTEDRYTYETFTYENGEKITTHTLVKYWDSNSLVWTYEIDGEQVSESEWNELYDSLHSDGTAYILDGTVSDLTHTISATESSVRKISLTLGKDEIPISVEGQSREWAYYHILAAYQEIYGEGEILNDGDYWYYIDGLAYAELIDFDLDGQDELILAYQDGTIDTDSIYETLHYTVEVWADTGDGVERVFSGIASVENDGLIDIPIQEDDGIPYFEQYKDYNDEFRCNIWEYNGSSFDKKSYLYGINAYAETGQQYFEVDGESITLEEWGSIYSQWIPSGKCYYLYTGSSDWLDDTLEITNNTITELYALLEVDSESEIGESDGEAVDWKQLYTDYINELPEEDYYNTLYDCEYSYSLAYINDDDIPELIAQMNHSKVTVGINYSYYVVVSCDGTKLHQKTSTKSLDGVFSYIDRGSLYCTNGGISVENSIVSVFYEYVYSLEDGDFVELFKGSFSDDNALKEDPEGKATYEIIKMDGITNVTDVSRDEYLERLGSVYDASRATTPVFVSAEEIIGQIEAY